MKKPTLARVSAAKTTPSTHVRAHVVVPFLICSAMLSAYLLSCRCIYHPYRINTKFKHSQLRLSVSKSCLTNPNFACLLELTLPQITLPLLEVSNLYSIQLLTGVGSVNSIILYKRYFI